MSLCHDDRVGENISFLKKRFVIYSELKKLIREQDMVRYLQIILAWFE